MHATWVAWRARPAPSPVTPPPSQTGSVQVLTPKVALSGARVGSRARRGGERAEPQSYYWLNEPVEVTGSCLSRCLGICFSARRDLAPPPSAGRWLGRSFPALVPPRMGANAAAGRRPAPVGGLAFGCSPARATTPRPERKERFVARRRWAMEQARGSSQGGERARVPSRRIGFWQRGQAGAQHGAAAASGAVAGFQSSRAWMRCQRALAAGLSQP